MPFSFERLEIPEVVRITARAFEDARGFFMETYKRADFEANGIPGTFMQDNYSHSSSPGVLRGLHYQKEPKAQGKLVWVIRGTIFDVAVDLRKGSPTYGRWVGVELSAAERASLWVPPGFAHGFCVISDQADVIYKCTNEYAPELDRGIRWDDPEIGIRWPVENPLLSAKDATAPLLRDADNNFVYEGVRV